MLTTMQVVAILGHELGHYFLSHILYNLVIVQLHLFVLFFSFGQIMGTQELYDSFGFYGTHPTIIGFILFSYLYSPVEHVICAARNIHILSFLTSSIFHEHVFAPQRIRGR